MKFLKRKRNIKSSFKYLILSILLSVTLYLLISNYPPNHIYTLGFVKISILIPFFIILFVLFNFILSLFFNRSLQTILLSLFLVTCLIFIVNKLTNPFFFIMLAALFVVIELIFYAFKKNS